MRCNFQALVSSPLVNRCRTTPWVLEKRPSVLGRPPAPRVENGHTASSSQVMESIQSFLAALRRLAGSRGSAPFPVVPPAAAALPRPVVVGRAACLGVLAGSVPSVPVGVSPSVPLPASGGSLGGSVALHLCRFRCLPHHVQSPSEHCCSPSSSTFSLSAAEVMVQSFVVLFRCCPSAAEFTWVSLHCGHFAPPPFPIVPGIAASRWRTSPLGSIACPVWLWESSRCCGGEGAVFS